MKKIVTIAAIIVASISHAKELQMVDYSAKNLYKTALPCSWIKKEVDFGYKHLLLLQKSKVTEIKITSYPPDYIEKEKWDNWKSWYLASLGTKVNIIAEESSERMKGAAIKLLLLDYTSGGVKFLQRIMILNHNNGLIVVECRSSVEEFNRYNEIFNVVMGRLELQEK